MIIDLPPMPRLMRSDVCPSRVPSCLLAAALLAPGAVAQEPEVDGGGWTLQQLDLDVEIDPAQRKVVVSGTMRLELAVAESAGPALAVNSREFALEWVELNGPDGSTVSLNERHPKRSAVRLASLRLPEPAQRGQVVDLDFRCVMRQRSNSFYVNQKAAFTNWVAGWYPFPVPGPGRGFDAALISAPGTTTFRCPERWCSVSNGRRTAEKVEGGVRVETWELEKPVARSFVLAGLTRGRHQVGERTIDVYRLAGRDPERANEQAQSLAEAIDAMEERFGEFPYANFAVVEVPDGTVSWTAASQQGFIIATARCFRFGRNLPLFAHEAAHAWWGNLVGQRGQGSILCSESLAQYGAALAIETIEGGEAMTEFLRFSRAGYSPRQCAKGYFAMASRGQDRPLSQLGSGGWQHDLSDAKGHWVYHMLRRRVGDDVFFGTLRDLIDRYSGREMSLDDVRAAFVRAAPKGQLEQFFAQWLDRVGAPVLESSWKQVGDGEIELTVVQTQDGDPYELAVDVEVVDASGRHRHRVEIEKRETRVRLRAGKGVEEIVLDPDHQLLIWKSDY